MAQLIIQKGEFEHLKDRSVYNHNYYEHKRLKYVVLEKCNDDGDFYFFIIENSQEIFLGSSNFGFDNTQHLVVEFRDFYT